MVRHWFKVLFAFESFLVVAAWLLAADATLKFAWTALGITVAAGLAILVLHDAMRLRHGWLRGLVAVVLVIILALAGVGVDEVFKLGIRDSLDQFLGRWRW
jgi:hypothetical protein